MAEEQKTKIPWKLIGIGVGAAAVVGGGYLAYKAITGIPGMLMKPFTDAAKATAKAISDAPGAAARGEADRRAMALRNSANIHADKMRELLKSGDENEAFREFVSADLRYKMSAPFFRDAGRKSQRDLVLGLSNSLRDEYKNVFPAHYDRAIGLIDYEFLKIPHGADEHANAHFARLKKANRKYWEVRKGEKTKPVSTVKGLRLNTGFGTIDQSSPSLKLGSAVRWDGRSPLFWDGSGVGYAQHDVSDLRGQVDVSDLLGKGPPGPGPKSMPMPKMPGPMPGPPKPPKKHHGGPPGGPWWWDGPDDWAYPSDSRPPCPDDVHPADCERKGYRPHPRTITGSLKLGSSVKWDGSGVGHRRLGSAVKWDGSGVGRHRRGSGRRRGGRFGPGWGPWWGPEPYYVDPRPYCPPDVPDPECEPRGFQPRWRTINGELGDEQLGEELSRKPEAEGGGEFRDSTGQWRGAMSAWNMLRGECDCPGCPPPQKTGTFIGKPPKKVTVNIRPSGPMETWMNHPSPRWISSDPQIYDKRVWMTQKKFDFIPETSVSPAVTYPHDWRTDPMGWAEGGLAGGRID